MSAEPTPNVPTTRMIALGSAALTDGFSLIGIETVADATAEQLENLLAELVRRQEKALVFLEHNLARSQGPWLRRVREEGGRVVIAEKPEMFGRTLIYLGLAEGIAIYGLVVTILLLGRIG